MQRQLAIQRLQEQEKERQMRLEQQKHTIQMRAQMPAFPLPYAQVRSASNRVHYRSKAQLDYIIEYLVDNYSVIIIYMLLYRCSLCLPMLLEGWCTSLVLHPATQEPSVLLVLWRVLLCTTCT